MENSTLSTNLIIPSDEKLDKNASDLLWCKLNMFATVTYSLVFVLGTIGNGLVIFITGFQMKKTVHTVWILSLAISDFTFNVFLLFHIVYRGLEYHWPFGPIMCKLKDATFFFNLYTSIYLLVVISIDRCISVSFPVWARNHRTPRLASFVVLGICSLALVLCFPHLYFKKISSDVNQNKTKCSSTYSKIDNGGSIYHTVVLIRFIFGFTIPFSIIVVCYGAIVVRLRRSKFLQSNRPFKVITAVIVAFFICWFPFHIFHFFKVKFFYAPNLPTVVFIGIRLSYTLAYFNSCLNPILYFFMGYNFKEKLRFSFLSALETAFNDESNHRDTKMKIRSSAELETCDL